MKRHLLPWIAIQIILLITFLIWTLLSNQEGFWFVLLLAWLTSLVAITGSLWHKTGILAQKSRDDALIAISGYLSWVIVATAPFWLGIIREQGLAEALIAILAIIGGAIAFDLTVMMFDWEYSKTFVAKHLARSESS